MRIVLTDGLVSLGILLSAAGIGMWLIRGLGFHSIERRWQLLAAVALGLGTISLLVLGLGSLGTLNRPFWITFLIVSALSGAFAVPLNRGKEGGYIEPQPDAFTRRMHWLWLIAIGLGALALLGGTMPPGILWPAEGGGYDVLEYHLGAPKEYFDAGRISYLPHNIYSNFPFNVEMLYLLSMILHGDPIGGIFTAKLLNVALVMLAVAAVWLAGHEFGPASGLVAGLLAATCPFLVYLSGVAYVENGLVFFAAMALAALLRALRDSDRAARWVLLSGLFAGLACGCKYTGVIAVVMPLFVAALMLALRSRPIRLRLVGAFCGGCLIAFGPWLLKNTLATGNPVFPLAYDLIGAHEGVWNDEGAARWNEGHLPAQEDRSTGARFVRLWDQVIGSRFYGPVIALGLVFGGMALLMNMRNARGNQSTTIATMGSTVCWLMILIGSGGWLALTHLVDRFAIVLIVPCAVLSGMAWNHMKSTGLRVLGLAGLVGVGLWNSNTTVGFFNIRGSSLFKADLFGKTDWITDGPLSPPHLPRLNEILDAGERILVVADARRLYLRPGADTCVVFNRNPFAEAAERMSANDLIDWLRSQDYAYVYVDWSEMHRLRDSRYGFWASLTRDLFTRLEQAGLRRVEDFKFVPETAPYGTLYGVPEI